MRGQVTIVHPKRDEIVPVKHGEALKTSFIILYHDIIVGIYVFYINDNNSNNDNNNNNNNNNNNKNNNTNENNKLYSELEVH